MYHQFEEIGKRIRRLRRSAGFTQERLADELNISLDHLGKIETGKHRCSLDILIDIADLFDVSLDQLILGRVQSVPAERLDAVIEELTALRKML